ncbi:ATP-binding protein [Cupriavidus pauculus]|uniref:ATP-binding protein n=1 Tax=Cupriavidus pauculus TaxID=82633 RepID=UPI001EE1B878|nr:ATP-binding protein [Cupriavidus pauculus]GJG98557.1 ATP-binding protein [Cupriavidus pauculus]
MTDTLEVLPDPVSLIESMRAIGYTTETAVADVIDNSISANASTVRIEYDASEEPFVAILDDGHGMDAAALTNAMRHGSRNPADLRSSHDLGRFGLGLKTASLAQCRKLTVVSKQGENIHARCWDLDFVQVENRWVVVVPSANERKTLPMYEHLLAQKSGTLVVWQSLDKLMAGSSNPVEEMKSRMSELHSHLSFVFHRFTRKEGGFPTVDIIVNGLKLKSLDPFLKDNSFTQPLEGQEIRIEDELIAVQPYVLPHITHLAGDQIDIAGGREGLRSSQGFYVYRNRRLVIWGTWFRLVPKEEFFKLTRVQVDIPNSLDHLWALDIKKSAAYPPDIIRNRLRDLIPHFANTSRTTITYPGRKQKHQNGFYPLWERVEPSHGTFRYQINPEHPVIRKLSDNLDPDAHKSLQHILELIAAALPFESIYSDMCSDKRSGNKDNQLTEILMLAGKIMEITKLNLPTVLSLDPIARFPQYHDVLYKELG